MSDFMIADDGDPLEKYRQGGHGASIAPVYPPRGMLALVAGTLAVAILCFLPAVRPMNWAGYAVGSFGTSLAVIAYRQVDLRRSAGDTYVAKPLMSRVVAMLLFISIVCACVHVYFALMTERTL